jgi:serine/threonine protein kinase
VTAAFAGYDCTERLSVDAFGEVWAGTDPSGRRVQFRRIDRALAQKRSFTAAVLRNGDRLSGVDHPNLVATIAVGHDDDELVVVEDAHDGLISLETVLREARLTNARAGLPLAVYIVRQVLGALARIHRAGVVHAGVHPRSVFVDKRGDVRLGDVVCARALAAAAMEDDSLLRGLLGYVAPELALGDEPGPRSDVFSVAALLTELATSSPPPGLIEGPRSLTALAEKALKTDARQRFADAAELGAALADVARTLGSEPDASAVARFVAEARGGADQSLVAETENMLAGLDIVGEVSASDVVELAEARARQGSAWDHTPLPPPVPLGRDETRPSDRFTLRAETPSPAVRVQTSDVISESLVTPAPALRSPLHPRTPAVPSVRTLGPADQTIMAPPVTRAVSAIPIDPRLAALPPLSELRRARARTGSRTLWVVALATAALAGVVAWKSGVFHSRERAGTGLTAKDPRAAAAHVQESKRNHYADVVIESDLANAAVWMNLGKTPVDSLPLSSAGVYELRLQQDGFKVADVVVTPEQWTGTGEAMRAAVDVALEPAPVRYVAPAAPTQAPTAAGVSRKSGKGRLHVASDPPGAQVWLLVGFTPSVRVQNLATEMNHEFKVVLDGRVPAFVEIAATDFLEPTGQTRSEILRKVALRPRPKDAKDRK